MNDEGVDIYEVRLRQARVPGGPAQLSPNRATRSPGTGHAHGQMPAARSPIGAPTWGNARPCPGRWHQRPTVANA